MTRSELVQTFANLREKWPQAWPGLNVVLDSALRRLGQDPEKASDPRSEAMRACAFEVARRIEAKAPALAKRRTEPAYHNRLHFADVLVALTFLLLQARAGRHSNHPAALRTDALSQTEWQTILTVVAHDWQHPGAVNQFPTQIESATVSKLLPVMKKMGVNHQDQAVVARLILKTDPRFVKTSHEAIQSRPFDVADELCMTVMIQEADILASATSEMGPGLTQQLAQEWRPHSPQMAAQLLTPQGRLNFLKFGAMFSSAPSLGLGLDKMVNLQIKALTAGSF